MGCFSSSFSLGALLVKSGKEAPHLELLYQTAAQRLLGSPDLPALPHSPRAEG